MLGALSRLCLAPGLLLPVFAQQSVVLLSTNPDIIYNPPLCVPSSIMVGCTSPWQLSNDTIPGTTVVYTDGPIPQAGNVVPQMFLDFRASSLYLRTTFCSNATVNFTLTSEPIDVSITQQVNTSISSVAAVNIAETQMTTLGITFLPEDFPTRFDIESITFTVSNASATSSFLPSASLPHSRFPPSLVSIPTNPSASNSGARNHTGVIVGAVLGGVLGTLILAFIFFAIFFFRLGHATTLRLRSRVAGWNSR